MATFDITNKVDRVDLERRIISLIKKQRRFMQATFYGHTPEVNGLVEIASRPYFIDEDKEDWEYAVMEKVIKDIDRLGAAEVDLELRYNDYLKIERLRVDNTPPS